ncbi:hypothetical protein TcWFU_005501 [Taenia crassiceps]|uniref:Uncharacterized protein n=1 Tax=Taenia crassiceps TaxID=6207 RepID=A0ABR4QRE1_9CEST
MSQNLAYLAPSNRRQWGCRFRKEELNKKARGKRSIVLSLYSFYHDLSEEDIKLAECGKLDLDHPIHLRKLRYLLTLTSS